MDPIDKAIEEIKSLGPCETFSYRAIAKKYSIVRTTLMRRHKGIHAPRTTCVSNTQKLNPQQEAELVKYIEGLTARRLQPTREMIRNFASAIANQDVGKNWANRFINRHQNNIESHWTAGMDRDRHRADSEKKYQLFFQLLLEKIEEYKIQPQHLYNIDEKGFLIGVIGRSKRIFSKAMWDSKEVREALQDGNREWITLLACICGDGSALPPGLLFASASSSIQSSWVEGIRAGKHEAFVSTSPNGWNNNNIGLAWLEQVFDRYTKEKAQKDRRAWRLLILDGHGSHVTMDFINYCEQNRILLMVFPPHSTHTLQPLDVVMFKPLSTAYSNALTKHLHNAQGLIPVNKGDFFQLFWDAWVESFKEKTILKSFEATGIWPTNGEVILKRFIKSTPEPQDSQESSTSVLSGKDWLKIKTLIQNQRSEDVQKLQRSFHHISVRNDLLETEVEGLRQAVLSSKKHKKKSKTLDLQQRKEYHGGAVFWSPKKIREAQFRERVKKQQEEEQKLKRARTKAEKAQQKVLKLQEKEERERLRVKKKKKERERIKAEKEAEHERKKQEKENSKKAIQTSLKGKRKAPKPVTKTVQKKQKRGVNAEVGGDAQARDPEPMRTTRGGRNIKVPLKLK